MKLIFPGDDVQIIHYPGGELQVRLKDPASYRQLDRVDIRATLKSTTDLMALILLSSAIRGVNPDVVLALWAPYLPYARADRRFVDGDCHGLQFVGDLLRIGCFDTIRTLDVHNESKTYRYVGRLMSFHPDELHRLSFHDFAKRAEMPGDEAPIVLYPDAGAAERYKRINPCGLVADKHRDPATGKIESFIVPEEAGSRPTLIVDDLCDGGATFLGIANVIRARHRDAILGLYVTHGIFSKGIEGLLTQFDVIYTTNSFCSEPVEVNGVLVVYDAWDAMTEWKGLL